MRTHVINLGSDFQYGRHKGTFSSPVIATLLRSAPSVRFGPHPPPEEPGVFARRKIFGGSRDYFDWGFRTLDPRLWFGFESERQFVSEPIISDWFSPQSRGSTTHTTLKSLPGEFKPPTRSWDRARGRRSFRWNRFSVQIKPGRASLQDPRLRAAGWKRTAVGSVAANAKLVPTMPGQKMKTTTQNGIVVGYCCQVADADV